MSDHHVYKQVEITGTSPKSIDDAVNNAVTRAGKTVRNMRWMEVTDIRGNLQDQKINLWQVTVKIGFSLED